MNTEQVRLKPFAFWDLLGDWISWAFGNPGSVWLYFRLFRRLYDWFPWKPKGRLMLWIIRDGDGRLTHYEFARLKPGAPSWLWRSVEGKPFYEARIVTASAVNATVTTTKKKV